MLLAHQGGWDEIALVATPVAVFAGLLWLANRRAEARLRSEPDRGDPDRGDAGRGPQADPEDAVPPPPPA